MSRLCLSRTPFTTLAFTAALLAAPALAAASSFTVDPMQLNLSRRTTSQLITVTNRSAQELRFEIKAFKWDQDDTGQMRLESTQDIVLFPSLVTIKPGQQQKVRIGTTAQYGPMEASYRIFIEELPAAPSASATGAQVAMRTRIGVPLFLEPTVKPTGGAELTGVTIADGKVSAHLRNTGNTHVMVDSVVLRGSSTSGATFEHKVDGWYLLPGRSQLFDAALTRAECTPSNAVTAQASVNGQTVTATGTVSPSACGGAR
jgi:fimbrial chaperone protein